MNFNKRSQNEQNFFTISRNARKFCQKILKKLQILPQDSETTKNVIKRLRNSSKHGEVNANFVQRSRNNRKFCQMITKKPRTSTKKKGKNNCKFHQKRRINRTRFQNTTNFVKRSKVRHKFI